MNVELFIPCFVDQLFPQVAFDMVKILERVGCTVHYNTSQTCCGQPAFNAGYWNQARDVAAKFLDDTKSANYVVAPSASCTGFVRNYYGKLFDNSSRHNEVKDLARRSMEFTEFLTEVMHVDKVGAVLEGKATYHDSCAALRECSIKEGPRRLLANVKGLELLEMKDVETCCGFGGTFAVKFEPISIAMADQKIDHAMATGADYIISTDMSCLMHLDARIRERELPLRSLHIAQVLASGWEWN
jgi:L-lactate dehydrogenase complex protein LldE